MRFDISVVVQQTVLMDMINGKKISNYILSRMTLKAGRPSNLFCMRC